MLWIFFTFIIKSETSGSEKNTGGRKSQFLCAFTVMCWVCIYTSIGTETERAGKYDAVYYFFIFKQFSWEIF